MFKWDVEKFGYFIDWFRLWLVEMVIKDVDVGVWVVVIYVIYIFKDIGMLELDEIDLIGWLIFDLELCVWRVVIDFFVGCVDDLIEGKVEEMGGSDVIDEVLGEEDDDDYFFFCWDWISVKCFVEFFVVYDV